MQFTHDLRTPLHGITGLSEAILSRRDISKEVEKPLKIIKSQANRLSALVSDIVYGPTGSLVLRRLWSYSSMLASTRRVRRHGTDTWEQYGYLVEGILVPARKYW